MRDFEIGFQALSFRNSLEKLARSNCSCFNPVKLFDDESSAAANLITKLVDFLDTEGPILH